MTFTSSQCLLCQDPKITFLAERNDKFFGHKIYWQCGTCGLTFLDAKCRLDKNAERTRYDLHQNNLRNKGYIKFLNQITKPLNQKLSAGSNGLDFGCGHTPVLSALLEQNGHTVKNYDPHYFSDKTLLQKTYDFITCTETAEHFYNPRQEFLLLKKLLKPKDGLLALMTSLWIPDQNQNFLDWWYPRDPTHVCFYQKQTLYWIAEWLNLKTEWFHQNTFIFLNKGLKANRRHLHEN